MLYSKIKRSIDIRTKYNDGANQELLSMMQTRNSKVDCTLTIDSTSKIHSGAILRPQMSLPTKYQQSSPINMDYKAHFFLSIGTHNVRESFTEK
jgi:hypothetical protein